jgi:hypothetical protein
LKVKKKYEKLAIWKVQNGFENGKSVQNLCNSGLLDRETKFVQLCATLCNFTLKLSKMGSKIDGFFLKNGQKKGKKGF